MPVINARDLVAFPQGSNASDTVIGDIHFNLTTLEHWNYTLYDNGTLSNGSWCILTFEPYTPSLLHPNGSFINATWCYTPINPLGTRGKIGVGFAVGFGLLLVTTLMSLRKHGRLFLPAEKRFRPIGRRWQWYWGILTCITALISLFTAVDVDRYYMPEIPIVLTSFFWYLMQMCTMALVWEAVRHWGSWMERQFIDPDPFVLPQDGRRYLFEFFIPLVFYLFLWLNFFLLVPRNWGVIEKQRSIEQTNDVAMPGATDSRFKAAAFMLFVAWLVTVVSLRHSIQHYLPRNRGLLNRAIGILTSTPPRLLSLLLLSLGMIAYQALCAWEFQYSVLKVDGDRLAIFLGGYAPSLLILLVQAIYGWIAPNEDRELIRQRRIRGAEVDRDLGIVHKPAWWRRLNGDHISSGTSMRDRIARNVHEIGGGRATTRGIDQSYDTRAREAETAAAAADSVEMGALSRSASRSTTASSQPQYESYVGKSDRRRTERTIQAAASMLFPGAAGPAVDRRAGLMQDGPPPPPYRDGDADAPRGRAQEQETGQRPSTAERSNSTGTLASLSGPPQQVRSMLDI